jgi:hypothetical protein
VTNLWSFFAFHSETLTTQLSEFTAYRKLAIGLHSLSYRTTESEYPAMTQSTRQILHLLLAALVLVSTATEVAVADSSVAELPYGSIKQVGDLYYYRWHNGHIYYTKYKEKAIRRVNRHLDSDHPSSHYSEHSSAVRHQHYSFTSAQDLYPENEIATEATEVRTCADGTCYDKRIYHPSGKLGPLPSDLHTMYHVAGLGEIMHPSSGSQLERLSEQAWSAATRGRNMASMCNHNQGPGKFTPGNTSKCWCAAGVEESLNTSGICHGVSGNAIDLRNNINTSSCPALHAINSTDPFSAPFGSVIVYRTSRHPFGHTEVVIPASAEAAATMHVKVGTKIYCSDFCSPQPFLGRNKVTGQITNFVAKMFSL